MLRVKQSGATPGPLWVHSIFYTIQGEGPFSGHPAVFIRLGGCNLQCLGCDTIYVDGMKQILVDDIVHDARKLQSEVIHPTNQLYVITGGEPFRQPIIPLVNRLRALGATVQIETNGTLAPAEKCHAMVVCSPKTPRIAPGLLESGIDALKYVLEADHIGADGLPTSVLGKAIKPARPPEGWHGKIYISPFDCGDPVENVRHVQAASDVCMRFGYTLNLQVHKIVGLP